MEASHAVSTRSSHQRFPGAVVTLPMSQSTSGNRQVPCAHEVLLGVPSEHQQALQVELSRRSSAELAFSVPVTDQEIVIQMHRTQKHRFG